MQRFLWPLVGLIVIAAIAVALIIVASPRAAGGAGKYVEPDPDTRIVGITRDAMPLGMSESFLEEKRRARSDDDLISQF